MDIDIDKEREKFEITDEEFKQNADEIWGELAISATPQENPTFAIVGGQAGSGKTSLVAKKYNELGKNAIIIDQDEIRSKYPQKLYRQIVENYDDRAEYLILKPYVLRMRQELVDRARNGKYNVIMESALMAVDSFIRQGKPFKEDGYNMNFSVITVPELEANMSTLNRYCYYLEKYGECRRNTKLDPEAENKVKANITKLENSGLFDNVDVYVRGKELDELPSKIYSKKESHGETTLQAYQRGQRMYLPHTLKTFEKRYEKFKSILPDDQLGILETLNDTYKSLNSKGREDE
jgi:hypothetical protein